MLRVFKGVGVLPFINSSTFDYNKKKAQFSKWSHVFVHSSGFNRPVVKDTKILFCK